MDVKMMNSPTYIKNVQDDDVRGGGAQRIGCLHPNLIRREEGEVARDAAGVALVCRAVANALFLRAVPPAHRSKGQEENSLTALIDHAVTMKYQNQLLSHLSLYLRVYLVWMWVSPRPPGLHLQFRSLVL